MRGMWRTVLAWETQDKPRRCKPAPRPGQFNSCGHDEADGGPFSRGEGFAGGAWLLAGTADEGEGGAADIGERPGCCAGADAAGVLAEGDVAHVEQAVLDGPVVASKLQQGGGIELVEGQAGDGVDDLARTAILQFADALDAADGGDPGPVLVEAGG